MEGLSRNTGARRNQAESTPDHLSESETHSEKDGCNNRNSDKCKCVAKRCAVRVRRHEDALGIRGDRSNLIGCSCVVVRVMTPQGDILTKYRKMWRTAVGVPLAVVLVGTVAVLTFVTPGTTKVRSDRLQQTLTLAGGVTIAPAPASETPAVSRSTIDLGTVPGAVIHPRIFYALVTDSEQGSPNAQGRVVLKYVKYPAWVVEERGVVTPPMCCPNRPGAPYSDHQRTNAGSGTLWTFYSARTGGYLFAQS